MGCRADAFQLIVETTQCPMIGVTFLLQLPTLPTELTREPFINSRGTKCVAVNHNWFLMNEQERGRWSFRIIVSGFYDTLNAWKFPLYWMIDAHHHFPCIKCSGITEFLMVNALIAPKSSTRALKLTKLMNYSIWGRRNCWCSATIRVGFGWRKFFVSSIAVN